MYEEFVESFKGDEGPGKDGGVKAFVRGGVVAPGSRSVDASGASCQAVNAHTVFEFDLLQPAVFPSTPWVHTAVPSALLSMLLALPWAV